MSFLAPGAFFLGLLLPVIVALYLLKLRRIEQQVPSTYLWKRMVRDVEANAPWQRLRPNLLMILQLLFLLAMIFALTRPFTWTEGAGGQAAILILDTSASMAATDVQPSRIESAKQRARQLVDDQADNARVTIIEAGREARVLLSSSLDRRQAHVAIESVQAGTGGSDLGVALELASAIAARQPGTEIIVLSDGRADLPDRLPVKGALRYIPFGLSGDNQAISLLTLEGTTAFAQVTNYGSAPVSRRLSLYADGLLINAYDLTGIPAGGQENVIVEDIPEDTRVLEARLEGDRLQDDRLKSGDILALDDTARTVASSAAPIPVRLVTPGSRFLTTALSLLPSVQLTEQTIQLPEVNPTPAAGATPTAAPSPTTAPAEDLPATAALTIFDTNVPDVLPTQGSLLFIAPPRSTEYFTVTGLVASPAPRVIDPADPLMANLSLDGVSVFDAVQIPLPDWATPVVAGETEEGNTPLLFRGEVAGRRIAVLAFDLRHSDLPLQIAFPLLWSNLIDWLAPGSGSAVPPQVLPGESLSIAAPLGSPSARVVLPDGQAVEVQSENGRFLFNDTTQLGEYQVTFDPPEPGAEAPAPAVFTVNLFTPLESDLLPADSLPGVQPEAGPAGEVTQRAMREWWRPLAMLALGLLVGEWLVYHRAGLARVLDMLRVRKPIGSKR